jgi:hypothetical protein
MVLNFSRLIKSSGTETHPAAKTQSIGLPAYAQLAQVFAEPLRQLYRDPILCAVNRDSSIYRDYPIWQLYRDPRLSAVNRDYPIWQLCLDTETFSHLPGLYIWTKSFQPSTGPDSYRDLQKLMPARAAGGN